MANSLWISWEPLSQCKPAKRNPKGHDLPSLKSSIKRWGFNELPARNERTSRLVVGHGRIEALAEMKTQGEPAPTNVRVKGDDWLVPVLRGLSFANEQEAEAYLVASNRLVERGGWSNPNMLANLLDSVRSKTPSLDGVGFTAKDVDRMLARVTRETPGDDSDDVPEPPKKPVAKLGDVWQLGDHLIACGDCRDVSLLARLFDKPAELVIGDPPYGMGKEKEGVLGDNQYGTKLDKFQMEWWSAGRPHWVNTAAAYIWGNAPDLWRLWYSQLSTSEILTFRNEIVWDKGSGSGQNSAIHLVYPTTTERCLFFCLGRQGFGNKNKDRFCEGFEVIRAYLADEAKRLGFGAKQIHKMTGTKDMWCHWFTRSQWTLISKKHYETLQATGGFAKPWSDLKALYQDALSEAREERDQERAYHDNAHEKMSDVWQFLRVHGAERFGHATPKPVALMIRSIKTSCTPGGIVYDPFSGTGPVLVAAEQVGRVCRAVELNPAYVDVVIERWQRATGGKARRR